MNNIVHITHTNILIDSRILKEMAAISQGIDGYNVFGCGVEERPSSPAKNIHQDNTNKNSDNYFNIQLKSKACTFLPKLIRHAINYAELIFKMYFTVRKHQPSVIHCHDETVLPIALLLKLTFRAKLIYDAHELESEKNGVSKFKSKAIYLLEKISFRYIDNLIIVSPSIQKWYHKEFTVKRSSVVLNSPVVSTSKSIYGKNYLREKYNIPEDCRIFIYNGGLTQGRGIELIINVFRTIGVQAHVVFLGYGGIYENLKKIESECSNIHVHDAVPHEDLVSVARTADVGLCLIQNVSLSDYYCLPNKLFEYLFSGLPVLASNFPDISHLLFKHGVGWCVNVEENSIKDSVMTIQNCLELPEINQSSLDELTWDKQKKVLISVYSGLMSESFLHPKQ